MKPIARFAYATRRVLGTDHAVANVVYDNAPAPRRRRWVVAFALCNGTPSHTATYATRKEALDTAAAPLLTKLREAIA